jgi:diacylglycerol kinase
MIDFFRKRIMSFKFALAGLKLFFVETNFIIHLIALLFVVILGIYVHLTTSEWLFVISASFFVLIAESVNTVVEKTMDRISEAYDVKIKNIKDMSAAFVLLTAIYAVIVGVLIFTPKLF